MKDATWTELLGTIVRKILLALAKLVVFFIWLILSAVQILLMEVTKSMKAWLFPGRK